MKGQRDREDAEDERGGANQVDERHQTDRGLDDEQAGRRRATRRRDRKDPCARQYMAKANGGGNLEDAAHKIAHVAMIASSTRRVTPGQMQATIPATSPLAPDRMSDQ